MNKFDKDPSSEAEGVIRRETWKLIIVATWVTIEQQPKPNNST